MDAEKPNLILFGGDTLWDDAPSIPKPKPRAWAEKYWRMFANSLVARKVPWAVVLGNHDYGIQQMTPHDLLSFDATYNGSLTVPTDQDTGYYIDILPFAGSAGDDTVLTRVLLMHSGQEGFFEYHKQWYVQFAADMRKKDATNRLRKAVAGVSSHAANSPPTIAVMHIAPPDMLHIYNRGSYYGYMRDDDGVCCQKTGGSGVFEAMKEEGNVRLMMFGHDHGNDFIGQSNGTFYTYALKTGIGSYPGSRRGVRVFEIAAVPSTQAASIRTKGMTLFTDVFDNMPTNTTLSVSTYLRLISGKIVNPLDEHIKYAPYAQLGGCCQKRPIPAIIIAVCALIGLILLVALPVLYILWRTCRKTSMQPHSSSLHSSLRSSGGSDSDRASMLGPELFGSGASSSVSSSGLPPLYPRDGVEMSDFRNDHEPTERTNASNPTLPLFGEFFNPPTSSNAGTPPPGMAVKSLLYRYLPVSGNKNDSKVD